MTKKENNAKSGLKHKLFQILVITIIISIAVIGTFLVHKIVLVFDQWLNFISITQTILLVILLVISVRILFKIRPYQGPSQSKLVPNIDNISNKINDVQKVIENKIIDLKNLVDSINKIINNIDQGINAVDVKVRDLQKDISNLNRSIGNINNTIIGKINDVQKVIENKIIDLKNLVDSIDKINQGLCIRTVDELAKAYGGIYIVNVVKETADYLYNKIYSLYREAFKNLLKNDPTVFQNLCVKISINIPNFSNPLDKVSFIAMYDECIENKLISGVGVNKNLLENEFKKVLEEIVSNGITNVINKIDINNIKNKICGGQKTLL